MTEIQRPIEARFPEATHQNLNFAHGLVTAGLEGAVASGAVIAGLEKLKGLFTDIRGNSKEI